MNRNIPKPASPRMKRVLALMTLAFASGAASAALIDIANAPLSSASSTVVKPNVNFVLDTSGSMAWTHAPDDAENFHNRFGYRTKQCNSMYYDPNLNYVPPKNADGTNFLRRLLHGGVGGRLPDELRHRQPEHLLLRLRQHVELGPRQRLGAGGHYYRYTGTQAEDFLNTSSLFYRECNTPLNFVPTTPSW